MKIKERYVYLVCTKCSNRNYTTHKRLKAAYKLEKKKFCRFCREHTPHKERKLYHRVHAFRGIAPLAPSSRVGRLRCATRRRPSRRPTRRPTCRQGRILPA